MTENVNEPERWALSSGMRGTDTPLDTDRGNIESMKVEASEIHRSDSAAFIWVDIEDNNYAMTHLTADDAEGIATVLLFLADKWRKENTDGTTR